MNLSRGTKKWFGWGFAAVLFAYVWFTGGKWAHYVVPILVAVSLIVIIAQRRMNRDKSS
jgi:hypothetical protein